LFETARTEEQTLLINAARDYARRELTERDRAWDQDESSNVEVLPQLADMGFLTLTIPEESGGLGCDYATYAAILHEVSYAAPSVSVAISVHNMVGTVLAAHAASPEREQWLQSWGRAEALSAFALSEANAGSDPAGTRTRADRVDGGYRLNGEKMWITSGLSARWFLTLVRTGSGLGKEGLTALMVDGQGPGIERTKIVGKMGIRGSETAVVAFSDVFVPESHRIGDEGEGLGVLLAALDRGRIGIASQATGIAHACVDLMVDYAKQREQFGTPIANFQAIQCMIADSAVELAAACELIQFAAAKLDAGRPIPAASAKAKLYATEAANRIAYRAVQVHGATGYVREHRVEQLYRDARVTTIYEGTSEVQRIIIARDLIRRHLH
jgi:alkylation response protein AidB-like acyl-CoA dehydrogenase